MADGTAELRGLAARLKAAGKEGRGLRRELNDALAEAAKPIAEKVATAGHLRPYMPDRYAEVLAADLGARVVTVLGGDPRVQVRAQARERKRHIVLLNSGFIAHPKWPRGPRKSWSWQSRQTGGMRPGFFDGACRDAVPEVRDKVMQALAETARKITHG